MNIYDHEIHFDNHTVIVDYSFNRVGASFPEGDFYCIVNQLNIKT